MKLYTAAMPPNPRRVNQFLQYKGVTLDTEIVDMGKAAHFSSEYKAINPSSTLPALKLDDGTVLCEVIGILHYLENAFPERPLLGTPGQMQAEVLSHMHFILLSGLQSIAEALRNGSEGFKDRALPGPLNLEQIPELVPRGRKRLAHFYETMNATLQDKEFLVGGVLTQADIDLRVICDFAAIIRQKVPEDCPNLAAHQQRVAELIPLS
jgi:glutathione S-transferase